MKLKSTFTFIAFLLSAATFGQTLVPYYEVVTEYNRGTATNKGRWGYKTAWAKKTEAIYDRAYPIKDGFAKVKKDGKYGVVDATGEIVIPCVADEMSEIGNGLVSITIENKGHSLVDMEQNIIVPAFRYAKIGGFSEEMGIFKSDGYYGFLNTRGKEAIKAKYDEAKDFRNGYARVEKEDKYGYVDKKGKEVIPVQYDYAIGNYSDGLFCVKKNDLYGYIDKSNKIIIPFQYKSASEFSEGLAVVGQNDKYGCIDNKGQMVIPAVYDKIEKFSCGLALAQKDNRWFFMDKTGKEAFAYEFENYRSFSDSFAVVKKDKKFGYINTAGEIVVPIIYEWADDFEDGLAYVNLNFMGRDIRGYIDKKGYKYYKIPDFEAEKKQREKQKEEEKNLAGYLKGYYNKMEMNDGHRIYKATSYKYTNNFRIKRISDTQIHIHINEVTRDQYNLIDSTLQIMVDVDMDVTYGDLPVTFSMGKDSQGFLLSLPPARNPVSEIISASGYYRPLDNKLTLYFTSKKFSWRIDAEKDFSYRPGSSND